ncbi:MAG: hypothetical protein AAF483_27970, partial [Planctomycetota bacterium]
GAHDPLVEYKQAKLFTDEEKAELIRLLTIEPTDYDGNVMIHPWGNFGATFNLIGAFLTDIHVYADYFEASFQDFVEDGITHVEIRTGATQLSDFTGTQHGLDQFVKELIKVRDRIRHRVPTFSVKLIIASGRVPEGSEKKEDRLETVLNTALQLHEAYPDVVIGFDCVGKEQMTNQTRNVLSVWMKMKKDSSLGEKNKSINFYFHDGETDWADNQDVIDAVLLGTKRIGHAFNLVAFPRAEDELKRKGIAIEVCPISNQVLRYVQDLRIHPACGYIRRGLPCVLSPDDPLIFGNAGLSYDFWTAWMAWDLKLRDLKLLALNSIEFSAMTQQEKNATLDYFELEWDAFIADVIRTHDL